VTCSSSGWFNGDQRVCPVVATEIKNIKKSKGCGNWLWKKKLALYQKKVKCRRLWSYHI